MPIKVDLKINMLNLNVSVKPRCEKVHCWKQYANKLKSKLKVSRLRVSLIHTYIVLKMIHHSKTPRQLFLLWCYTCFNPRVEGGMLYKLKLVVNAFVFFLSLGFIRQALDPSTP